VALALAQIVTMGTAGVRGQTPAAQNRFEKNVLAYEAADRTTPPPQGAILLVGDSQFYRWRTLDEDLPGYTVVNRGIDSFQTSDLLHYADRLVVPYAPRFIVTHVGGNDVNNGKTPEQILTDFQSFVGVELVEEPEALLRKGQWQRDSGLATACDARVRILEFAGAAHPQQQ
jgi:hypothetical protein